MSCLLTNEEFRINGGGVEICRPGYFGGQGDINIS